ncbi:translation initiation factor IF-2-like isoform X2 [Bombina bombina]|uniref:translation initiation factor IF-2-like isoform X2 n=1 Tax=Bombina bombina TaxID=8345 RepID=UPI00235A55F4|nr:translation initiation factor IF-2-like isoform X2 [Bombina bombina]
MGGLGGLERDRNLIGCSSVGAYSGLSRWMKRSYADKLSTVLSTESEAGEEAAQHPQASPSPRHESGADDSPPRGDMEDIPVPSSPEEDPAAEEIPAAAPHPPAAPRAPAARCAHTYPQR